MTRTRKIDDARGDPKGWVSPKLRDGVIREYDGHVAHLGSSCRSQDGRVLVLKSLHYVVQASIGSNFQTMYNTRMVLDTGSGYNVIRRDALPHDWQRHVVKEELPRLGDANGNPLALKHAVELRVRLGNGVYRATFLVAERLSCPTILGTAFLNQNVDAIRCRAGVVELLRSTVPILGHGTADEPVVEQPVNRKRCRDSLGSQPQATEQPSATTRLRLAESLRIPAHTQAKVRVVTGMDGLVCVEPKHSVFARYRVRVANGVHEVRKDHAFTTLLSNFSNEVRVLPKGTVVGYAVRTPMAMVQINGPFAKHIADVLHLPQAVRDARTDEEEVVATHGKDPDGYPTVRCEDGPPATSNTEKSPMEQSVPDKDWREYVDLSHLGDDVLKQRIMSMLEGFQDMWTGKLGEINVTSMDINLKPGTRPIHQNPYRAGPQARRILESHIQDQLSEGVISPARSEWASPVLLVPKKNGAMRFCVDFRRLNAATLADSYPLPRMEDCIDSLASARVFSTLDANWGYWQLPISPEDREKTTFTTHVGTFQYNRMPFGLRNAPATFQRALDVILSGVKWKSCLIYLDDIVIFSSNYEDHLEHVATILSLLREAGVSLKIAKSCFFRDKIDYLGHVIYPGRMGIAQGSKAATVVQR